jgi:hypothetical protein
MSLKRSETKNFDHENYAIVIAATKPFFFFLLISARSPLSSCRRGGASDILFSTGNTFLKTK